MNYSKLIVAGRLARDVELRQTAAGTQVANGTIAFETGNAQARRTVRLDFKCFGQRAQLLAQRAACGRAILLEGRLDEDVWADRANGQRRCKKVMVADLFALDWPPPEPQPNAPLMDGASAQAAVSDGEREELPSTGSAC